MSPEEFDEELDSDEEDWDESEEWDEEYWEDDGIDPMQYVALVAGFILRFRIPIAAVLVVAMLGGAAAVVVPMLLADDGPKGPTSHTWSFTVMQDEGGQFHDIFVADGETEVLTFQFLSPLNVSHVYVGAHFSENQENIGVNLCDYVTVIMDVTEANRNERYELSQTESRTNDCNVEGDAIWYNYNLTLPSNTEFEGTRAEALEQWDGVNGTGQGLWVIEVSVDSQTLWTDSGEDVEITIRWRTFDVLMTIMDEDQAAV